MGAARPPPRSQRPRSAAAAAAGVGAVGEPAGAAAGAAAVPGERPPAGPAALPGRGPGAGGRERRQPRARRAGAGRGAGGARRGAGAGGHRGGRRGRQGRRGRADAGEVRWVRGTPGSGGIPLRPVLGSGIGTVLFAVFLGFLGVRVRGLLQSGLPAVISAESSAGERRLQRAVICALGVIFGAAAPKASAPRQHPQHEPSPPALQGLFSRAVAPTSSLGVCYAECLSAASKEPGR